MKVLRCGVCKHARHLSAPAFASCCCASSPDFVGSRLRLQNSQRDKNPNSRRDNGDDGETWVITDNRNGGRHQTANNDCHLIKTRAVGEGARKKLVIVTARCLKIIAIITRIIIITEVSLAKAETLEILVIGPYWTEKAKTICW